MWVEHFWQKVLKYFWGHLMMENKMGRAKLPFIIPLYVHSVEPETRFYVSKNRTIHLMSLLISFLTILSSQISNNFFFSTLKKVNLKRNIFLEHSLLPKRLTTILKCCRLTNRRWSFLLSGNFNVATCKCECPGWQFDEKRSECEEKDDAFWDAMRCLCVSRTVAARGADIQHGQPCHGDHSISHQQFSICHTMNADTSPKKSNSQEKFAKQFNLFQYWLIRCLKIPI